MARDEPEDDGVLDEFGAGLEPELLHDRILVKGDRARGYTQTIGRLLHRHALGKQLQDLALTKRERGAAGTALRRRDKVSGWPARDDRADEDTSVERFLDGCE